MSLDLIGDYLRYDDFACMTDYNKLLLVLKYSRLKVFIDRRVGEIQGHSILSKLLELKSIGVNVDDFNVNFSLVESLNYLVQKTEKAISSAVDVSVLNKSGSFNIIKESIRPVDRCVEVQTTSYSLKVPEADAIVEYVGPNQKYRFNSIMAMDVKNKRSYILLGGVGLVMLKYEIPESG
jgi:hypothetical protein